jgi:chemotaxis protein MotB
MADGGEASHEIIIVRRHEEEEHAHHSSAWKVAHADFMTAMMAFFLIMWLINVTDDEVRKGISQYFNPIHLSSGSTDLKGLNNPDSSAAEKAGKKGPNEPAPPSAPLNPVKLAAGGGVPPEEAPSIKPAAGAGHEPTAEAGGARAAARVADGGTAAAPSGSAIEGGGYQNPFAVMAKIPSEAVRPGAVTADAILGDARQLGARGGEASRDPFDPAYWQLTPLPAARTDQPARADTLAEVPKGSSPDARAAVTLALPDAPRVDAPVMGAGLPPGASAATPAPATSPVELVTANGDVRRETVTAATAIANDVAKALQAVSAGAAPDISVKATPEGALVGLTDDATYSMFAVGSAVPDAKVVTLMARIAEALSKQTGQVIIRGYTDGRPFHTADNDNWRLSAARARVAYDLLVRGGLQETRVVAIEGHADRGLLNPGDPYAAENRRIEILLKVADR